MEDMKKEGVKKLTREDLAGIVGGAESNQTYTWTCSKCGQSFTGSRVVVTSLKNQHMKQH